MDGAGQSEAAEYPVFVFGEAKEARLSEVLNAAGPEGVALKDVERLEAAEGSAAEAVAIEKVAAEQPAADATLYADEYILRALERFDAWELLVYVTGVEAPWHIVLVNAGADAPAEDGGAESATAEDNGVVVTITPVNAGERLPAEAQSNLSDAGESDTAPAALAQAQGEAVPQATGMRRLLLSAPQPAEADAGTRYRVFEIGLENVDFSQYPDGFRVEVRLPEPIVGRDFALRHIDGETGEASDVEIQNLEMTLDAETGLEALGAFSFITHSFSPFVLEYKQDGAGPEAQSYTISAYMPTELSKMLEALFPDLDFGTVTGVTSSDSDKLTVTGVDEEGHESAAPVEWLVRMVEKFDDTVTLTKKWNDAGNQDGIRPSRGSNPSYMQYVVLYARIGSETPQVIYDGSQIADNSAVLTESAIQTGWVSGVNTILGIGGQTVRGFDENATPVATLTGVGQNTDYVVTFEGLPANVKRTGSEAVQKIIYTLAERKIDNYSIDQSSDGYALTKAVDSTDAAIISDAFSVGTGDVKAGPTQRRLCGAIRRIVNSIRATCRSMPPARRALRLPIPSMRPMCLSALARPCGTAHSIQAID